jgi:hypothetical protein
MWRPASLLSPIAKLVPLLNFEASVSKLERAKTIHSDDMAILIFVAYESAHSFLSCLPLNMYEFDCLILPYLESDVFLLFYCSHRELNFCHYSLPEGVSSVVPSGVNNLASHHCKCYRQLTAEYFVSEY